MHGWTSPHDWSGALPSVGISFQLGIEGEALQVKVWRWWRDGECGNIALRRGGTTFPEVVNGMASAFGALRRVCAGVST